MNYFEFSGLIQLIFIGPLRSKGGLCHTPSAHVHAHARAHDQNVQFLCLRQFLSNYKGQRLHAWHTLTSGEDQQKPVNHI